MFFDALLKGSKKGPFLEDPQNRQKTSKNSVFRPISTSRLCPPSVPPKTGFLAKKLPYGRDHNFWHFRKNGLFSPFFGPPKDPQNDLKNDVVSEHQNHYDKHVCEYASYSSHVHHNYFLICVVLVLKIAHQQGQFLVSF